MITSTLSQLHWYKIISPHFAAAIDYALSTNFADLQPGTYEIDGENVFAIVNEYTTKPHTDCGWESHLKYADIQIMIHGIEKFGYSPLVDQKPSVAYTPEKDVMLYSSAEEDPAYITLYPGQFIIFFPSDIHQPEVFKHHPAPVKKVVIKVKV